MMLEGFWVFIFIVVVSTFFIFIMTRGNEKATNSDNDEGEIAN